MKKSLYVLLGFVALTLSACGGAKKASCYFPGGKEMAAPNWICNPSVPGYAITAIGKAEKSMAGPRMAEQEAMMDAREKLAKKASAKAKGISKTESKSTKKDRWSTVKHQSMNARVKTKVLKIKMAPDGSLYVLMGIVE